MAKEQKRTSLINRFNSVLSILYVVALLISGPAIYKITRTQTIDSAASELKLFADVLDGVRQHVKSDMGLEMAKSGHSDLSMSSATLISKKLSASLLEKRPGHMLRIVSDNPLNPDNRATDFETELLYRFRHEDGLAEIVDEYYIDGEPYLITARPLVADTTCLACHGNSSVAPHELRDKYGTRGGFGYKAGRIEGANIVGMPTSELTKQSIERTVLVVGVLTIVFAILFANLNITVRRNIIDPIISIARAARAVSRGEMDRPINYARNDEIGRLAKSFELMRRSLTSVMRRQR